MKRSDQASIRNTFRSGLKHLRSFNHRPRTYNSTFISKRNIRHNSITSSLRRNHKQNQLKISKEKILEKNNKNLERRASNVRAKKLGTIRNTLQSGVSKQSEQFVALVENRARQIGLASFSLFTGNIFITKVTLPSLGLTPIVQR